MQLAAGAVLLVLLAQAASAPVAENRVEFITLAGETRVAQSEVCFFAAGSKEDFFSRFLATDDVRCLSADAVISLPPGSFNVFARNGSTLIDSHPTLIDNENPGEPGYRDVALALSPAATLEVAAARSDLREGEWLAVYLTNESRPESLASVHPVPRTEAKILVPADMPFVPMVVRRGAIVRVGKPTQLRAGETTSLPKVDQWGSGRDVVALLRTDALTAPDVPPRAPLVRLHGRTAEPLRPMFALRGAGRFEESLAIFKDVPPGTHQIRLSGEGWQKDEVTVTATSTAEVARPARALHARIGATVEVRASIGALATIASDVRCPGAGLHEPPGDEFEEETPEPAVRSVPTLRLLRCRGQGESRNCASVRELSLDSQRPDTGSAWSDLEPGVYVAELTYRWLTERSIEREVRPGGAETLTVALQPETVTGRVRHGSSPVQALVSFHHSLAPALSDESGNYTGVVGKGPDRNPVRVRICGGGGYQYLPESPVDKVLDIDIPKNKLVVRVVDERGRPLEKARIVGGPLFPEGDAVYAFMPFAPTDSAGETWFGNVVSDATLELCAAHTADRDQACAPPFKMGNRDLHRIEIVLPRRTTMSGKLLSTTPFLGGWIYLVSPAGAIVDTASVSPAGEFTLKRTGTPGEYLVSRSLSHPLVVFELPSAGVDGPLEFQMPAHARTLTVVLAKSSRKRAVALELAGRIIPPDVLVNHQMTRRLTHQLEPGQTLEFRDLAPGPLVVYSVPFIEDYPPEWRDLDPVEHPHLRIALPRFPVTGPVVSIE